MSDNQQQLINMLQAILLANGKSMSVNQLARLLEPEQIEGASIEAALQEMAQQLQGSCLELKQLAGGYRLQIRQQFSAYVARLWQERPQRYSRALLETLALIAYRQPATRGEIEDVRGVAVGSQIIRNLEERGWIKVVGHKEVPGRPAMFATTREFLDYFNLASLQDLPPLREIRDLSTAFERLQDTVLEKVEQSTDATDDEEQPAIHELSFSSLLAELEAMETDLKTDFQDLADTEAQE